MTIEAYDGRVVLVVGSRGLIGESLCRFFLSQGATVVGCSRTSMKVEHNRFRHHACSITDERAVVGMFQHLVRAEISPEIVVLGAAVPSTRMIAMVSSSDIDTVLSTNLRGALFVIREAVKSMTRRRYGRVIVLSSIRVPKPVRGCALYSSSKAALEQVIKVLPFEVGDLPITFNAIEISMVSDGMAAGLSDEVRAQLLNSLAVKRVCTTDDICNAVEFFARPESSYVTGQILRLGFV
jgi:3-oxoacyl-[acyl-carrier protein] reductase